MGRRAQAVRRIRRDGDMMKTFLVRYSDAMEEDSGLPERFSAFISGGSQSSVLYYVLKDGRVLVAVACGLN